MNPFYKSLVLLLAVVAIGATGCTTTAKFKIPADTTLQVTDRKVVTDSTGDWTTSPFFWTETGGAHYQLLDKKGKVIRTGKIKTKFRPVSIFWPPFALIYWPMGLQGEYNLTSKTGDTNVTVTGN